MDHGSNIMSALQFGYLRGPKNLAMTTTTYQLQMNGQIEGCSCTYLPIC